MVGPTETFRRGETIQEETETKKVIKMHALKIDNKM